VYWNTGYAVSRWRDGVTTGLTQDDNTVSWNTYPRTDGVNVLYRKSPCCGPSNPRIALHDGTTETTVGSVRSYANPGDDYAANGGWAAWTSPDAGGVLQVMVRSPGGAVRQVTNFGISSAMEALGVDGTVIFTTGTRRYRVTPTGAPEEFMKRVGTVLWRDDGFVVLVGGSALRLLP
jgi:hypothetical protein